MGGVNRILVGVVPRPEGGEGSRRADRRRVFVAALAAALLLTSLIGLNVEPAGAFGTSEPPPLPSVSAGGYMTCAVQEDGTAACWGENGVPANDVLNVSPGGAATPPAGVRFLEVNAGYATACGITTEQAVVCWGNDRFNKLNEPAGTFTHVAPGLNYVCALRTDGTVVCWGGDDPAAPGADALQRVVRDVPTGDFTQVSVGIRHACALRADGTIVCWGHNADGQTNVPPGIYSYVNVGNFTSCALRTDGTPVCWGRNQGGQQTYPEGTFTQLSTGFAHVCGLRPDGTVTCWGRSSEGQATPPAGTYTHVTTGTFHSCAMPTSGPPAVCWGNNQAGRVQPSMTATPPPQGLVDSPYSHQLTMATHVSPAPTFSLVSGELPPGVTLTPTGLLSGTPTTPGSYAFTVAASSNGLSPVDCPMGATGSLPCTPGDPNSVATATRTFNIDITIVTIDDTVLSNGNRGRVTGTVTCDAGEVFFIELSITQGATSGQGSTRGTCTGSTQTFGIEFLASGGSFTDGSAEVCVTPTTAPARSRSFTTLAEVCEEVTIDVV